MDAKVKVIVGTVIEKEGKYLLVQEAQEKCRGKWNLPAEILDAKWFDYEEILAMRSEIRNEGLLIGAIENVRNGLVAPMGIVRQY